MANAKDGRFLNSVVFEYRLLQSTEASVFNVQEDSSKYGNYLGTLRNYTLRITEILEFVHRLVF
jgi:hypothetical protein